MLKIFQLNSNSFSYENAYIFAFLSKIIYDDYYHIWKTLQNTNFNWLDKGNIQTLLIWIDSQNVLIIFRGTEKFNLQDWWTNLRFLRIKTQFCRIHNGFLKAWKSIENDIISLLKTKELKENKNINIWLGGHSQGGALATIASLFLPFTIKAVYTFGMPRIGNAKFAKNYNKLIPHHYRLTNDNDIVCYLPPLIIGYRHCGQQIYIDKNGNFFFDSKKIFWARLKDKFLRLRPAEKITDHSITNYLKILENYIFLDKHNKL